MHIIESGSNDAVLHGFHILNTILCIVSLFPVILIIVVLIRDHNFSRDKVGNILIAHMLIPISMYSITIICLSITWLVNDHQPLSVPVYQLFGFFINLSVILFPFSVAMRYTYYFWLVALERTIIRKYWYTGLVLFWTLTIVLLMPVGILKGFVPHSTGLFVTVPFTSKEPLLLTNTIFYLIIMFLGGIIHTFFAVMIVLKFSHLLKSTCHSNTVNTTNECNIPQNQPIQLKDVEANKTKTIFNNDNVNQQRSVTVSERAILKKFMPATIVYYITHGPFISFVLYETISGKEAPWEFQCFFTMLYSIATIIAPFVIIKANRKILEGIGFLIDDILGR